MHWFLLMVMMMAPVPWPGELWPQAPNPGPPWPDVAGSFCDTAPTNLFCADFEVADTACTAHGFTANVDWDCASTTTTPINGGARAARYLGTGVGNRFIDVVGGWVDQATICVQFNFFTPVAWPTTGTIFQVSNASPNGAVQARPTNGDVRVQCLPGGTINSGSLALADGNWFSADLQFTDATLTSELEIDDGVASDTAGPCVGPVNTMTGLRFQGHTTNTSQWSVDNILVTAGVCP